MQIEKWDIPGFPGQWAKIHRRATHGQAKAITKDYVESRGTPMWLSPVGIVYVNGTPLLAETSVVRNLVEDWHVTDADDKPVVWDVVKDSAGTITDMGTCVENAPEDVVKLIFAEAAGAMRDLFPDDETPAPNRAARRARAKS